MIIKNRIKTVLTFAIVAMAIFAAPAQAGPVEGQLGILTTETLAGNNPATSVPWEVGDTYRLVFVTSATRDAVPTDITEYNAFVQAAADVSALGLADADWKVIGSTATVDARDNTSTNIAINGTGEAIFLLDGSTTVVNDYADLWDGGLDHQIDMDENGTGELIGRIFAGTNTDGTARGRPLGGSDEDPPKVTTGEMQDPSGHWLVQYNSATTSLHSIYGLSDPLSIMSGDPNFPDVDAGDDMIGWSGGPVPLNPNIIEAEGSDWTSLTYEWTGEPNGIGDPDLDVVITDADQEYASVTITKTAPTGDATVITMTIAVNNEGRVDPPLTSTMTIDVYDDSCLAAKSVGTVELDPTDFDDNCITNLADFAVLAADWLVDYEITGPVEKP